MAVKVLYPRAAGEKSECHPLTGANWDCCDEHPHDSDTSYVYSTVLVGAETDLYLFTDPAGGDGNPGAIGGIDTIDSLTVYWTSKYDTNGNNATVAPVLSEHYGLPAAVETVGTAVDCTSSYAEHSQTWATKPSDGGRWTVFDLGVLQVGVRQTKGNPNGQTRTTQVRVEVDYTPWPTWPMSGIFGAALIMR